MDHWYQFYPCLRGPELISLLYERKQIIHNKTIAKSRAILLMKNNKARENYNSRKSNVTISVISLSVCLSIYFYVCSLMHLIETIKAITQSKILDGL